MAEGAGGRLLRRKKNLEGRESILGKEEFVERLIEYVK